MELLFSIGLHNAAVMAVLALLVWTVTRFSKSAPVAHLLWVLVLVKLLTPPVVNFDASRWTDFTRNSAKTAERPEPIVRQPEVAAAHDSSPLPERSVPVAVEAPPPAEVLEPSVVPEVALPQPVAPTSPWPPLPSFETIRTILAWTWLIGAALLAALAWIRITSFQRMLVQLPPAPQRLQALADDLAQRMGLKRSATVLQVASALPPFVWCFGSQRVVVLPRTLLDTLAEQQLALVLAHELAHLRRRDHWVRVVELTVSILYWWNPLVWWVRRQLHAAEEQCCDAWVLWLYPEQNQLYAESLLKSADIVSSRSLALSSPFLNSHTLRGRIESVLLNRSPRQATRVAVACLAILATAALPSGISVVRAQVPPEPKVAPPAPDVRKSDAPQPEAVQPEAAVAANPTLRDLMQQIAVFEQAYLPYDMKVMETFRFPDDLTPQERAKNLRADGRKHQRLMEYAQLAPRIWRRKETHLVDDEINQGPYEQFSDGERIVQRGPSSLSVNGVAATEYSIQHKKNAISNYLLCTPLTGVFCLSTFGNGPLFSQAFEDEDAVQLAWDQVDAKLTFVYGRPSWNMRFVLWLSRAHAWHPIRLQRFWNADDKLFHDEWEVTKFVQRGKLWRATEGTLRYRDLVEKGQPQDPKIKYSIDFKVLEEKFGSDVDPKQFHIDIPEGATVRDDRKPDAAPPPPEKTRAIKVTIVDVDGKPIPQASVKLPATRLRNYDLLTTDAHGVAQSAKAPADNVTVQITADGFRPVTWIMGNVDELRAIMAPVSSGTVTTAGKPVADAWVTNETLQIRADGYAYVPSRDWDGRNQDWSDNAGKFELKTPLTLRRDTAVVPLIAINPDRDRMAVRFIAADQLAQPQPLALQPVCHVRGQCLLEGAAETMDVDIGLASSTGQSLGFLSTRHSRVAGGLRVDFQLRLPPGDYVLKSRGSSYHAEFSIPVPIPAGQTELDLGTTKVPAPKTALLRGKPAPALDVLWRPGQEVTWEKLRGKVVVLDFWGTWCGPCVSGMPVLMDIAQRFREKPVEWISIHTPNLETFEKLDPAIAQCQEKSWNKRALPFTTVIDRPVADSEGAGKTEQNFGVVEWPTLIVVDQQGLVVGAVPKNKLAETIDRLLAAKDPETSTPPPKAEEQPVPKNLQPFQGTWDVERYGSLKWPADLDEARTWQWTIQGHEITWTRPGHATLRLSFAVNADFTGEAKSYDNKIELTVLDGPEQGQKCPGIFYWMKGQDTLWICFRDPGTGGERPSIMGFNGYDRQTLLALRPGKPRSATEAPAKPVPPQEENPLLKDGL